MCWKVYAICPSLATGFCGWRSLPVKLMQSINMDRKRKQQVCPSIFLLVGRWAIYACSSMAWACAYASSFLPAPCCRWALCVHAASLFFLGWDSQNKWVGICRLEWKEGGQVPQNICSKNEECVEVGLDVRGGVVGLAGSGHGNSLGAGWFGSRGR